MVSQPAPECLVLHDGELSDVCGLLGELRVPYTEHRGEPETLLADRAWDLVAASPARLLELDLTRGDTVAIVVVERDSRTLRSILNRAGVDLLVRRPVHREALRLVLLHALYRGPERRHLRRVSVGARVAFRCGLRGGKAVMVDLSTSGCRLLTPRSLEVGRELRVRLPAAPDGRRRGHLGGRVVRAGRDEQRRPVLGIAFAELDWRAQLALEETLDQFGTGPAIDPLAPARVPFEAAAEPDPPAPEVSERPVVLLGRDVSPEGMRIAPTPEIAPGDELCLALHSGPEEPLLLRARVEADCGDDGLDLRFLDLADEVQDALSRLLTACPVLEVRPGSEQGQGVILSAIVEPALDPLPAPID